jgi:CheY-like chemotaxis protein
MKGGFYFMCIDKILVVEDDLIITMEIQTLLEILGYQIYKASSSDEAIERAVEILPDLILMDIKIKGKYDGVKTVKMIKELIEVPVIYLTAYPDPKLIESIELTKPIVCLIKPFESKELISNIEIALYTNKHNINPNIKM